MIEFIETVVGIFYVGLLIALLLLLIFAIGETISDQKRRNEILKRKNLEIAEKYPYLHQLAAKSPLKDLEVY